jgi:hypothetical protein
METKKLDQVSSQPAQPSLPSIPSVARIIVLNNCQISGSVLRAALILMFLGAAPGVLMSFFGFGALRDVIKTVDTSLCTVGIALVVVGSMLERALRRCPVCQTRITKATEEKRHCLGCDTELWGYWDE